MRRIHAEHIASAFAPKAAVAQTLLDFAFVPGADVYGVQYS
jgi:hypothetical protein